MSLTLFVVINNVLSPAMEPKISGIFILSIISPTKFAAPSLVFITIKHSLYSTDLTNLLIRCDEVSVKGIL